MNVARTKACNIVTSRCIFPFLAATQWYFFSWVDTFPFARAPVRVVRGATAFELDEREKKTNSQVNKTSRVTRPFQAIRRKNEKNYGVVWYMVWYTLFKLRKHASSNNTQLVFMGGVFVPIQKTLKLIIQD